MVFDDFYGIYIQKGPSQSNLYLYVVFYDLSFFSLINVGFLFYKRGYILKRFLFCYYLFILHMF